MPENPYLDIDKRILGEIYTSKAPMDHLLKLCDEFGSRFGGTPGEKLAADYLAAQLRAYGLQNVRQEPIAYLGWRRGQASLRVTAPVERDIACITLPHSPPADLRGEIIDVGDGAPADFERLADEIAGKIVLTTSVTSPPGTRRWIHRSEKYGRSLLAGAIGFIFVNHYPGYGPATGSIGNFEDGEVEAGLIPGLSVNKEDGAYLQRLLARGEGVEVAFQSSDVCEPMTSWNIIGDWPGTAAEPEIVMLGCHYDGHDISQGATDPASGAVAVLEAARVLALMAPSLPHTIRFAFWGVEELGLIGSFLYARAHAVELANYRFYLNMDAAGYVPDRDIVLNEWPDLAPLLAGYRSQMALDFEIGQSVHAHSDHLPFLLNGVPTAGMETFKGSHSGRGYGHTRYDTVDKVRLKPLREAAALGARLALRVAGERDWPVTHRSEAAVAALFDKPAYQEEATIMARIADHYRAQRGH